MKFQTRIGNERSWFLGDTWHNLLECFGRQEDTRMFARKHFLSDLQDSVKEIRLSSFVDPGCVL